MAFYDDMKKALYKTKDNVTQKTGNYTEMSKLNASVSELEREIGSLYAKMGETCYRKYTEDPEHVDADMLPLYQKISDRIKLKEEYYVKLLYLKGFRRCDVCGKEIPADALFCNYCGSKQQPLEIESEKRICPNCGTPFEDHQLFCINCGFNLGTIQKAAKKVCANCGCELEEGAAFCMNCGKPVSNESTP